MSQQTNHAAPDTRRRLLATDEVAARLGRSEPGIRKLIAMGRLAAVKVGGRLMVHEDVLAELERAALGPGLAGEDMVTTMVPDDVRRRGGQR